MQLFGLENHFYHASIRKYVALFGSLFSDLYIKRVVEGSDREDFIKVPIKYGNGNMYVKADQDKSREQTKVSRILPAMAFELDTLYKDTSRKTNPLNRIQGEVNADVVSGKRGFQLNRVPYDFMFKLLIRTKNIDDMLQIVEQIVPAFDGNLSVNIENMAGLELNQNIIIRIEELNMTDSYEEEMKSRLVEWSITFELKGYLYKKTQDGFTIQEVDLVDEFGTLIEAYNTQPLSAELAILSSMDDAIDLLAATPVPLKTRKNRKKT